MLTRLVINAIKRLFGKVQAEPQTWQEAYAELKRENERLERFVVAVQQSVLNWSADLNKPNVLKITQATVDDSPIGSESSTTGRFTKLGVGQAPPTDAEHCAYMGSGSGRQFLLVTGGSSGTAGGPAVAFQFGVGTAITQGIGGYSSVAGGAFDRRLTIYSGSYDLLLGGAGGYVVDFFTPTDGAAAQVGTLNNAPSAGNPTYWLKVKVAGNVRYIPCWS